jgi:hypothetical protein
LVDIETVLFRIIFIGGQSGSLKKLLIPSLQLMNTNFYTYMISGYQLNDIR